jgi:hypothetical protein
MAKKIPKWLATEVGRIAKLSNAQLLDRLVDSAVEAGGDYGGDREWRLLWAVRDELEARLRKTGFLPSTKST